MEFEPIIGAVYTANTLVKGLVAGMSISLIAMGISLVAIILVGLALMYTRFGRATRAISDNPALARASGIDVDRVINVVWIVGGGLAGLAGVFFGLVINGITWFTGGQMLLLFFAQAVSANRARGEGKGHA